MRTGSIARTTHETAIQVAVNLDGTWHRTMSAPGIGFLDHMIEQFSRHSLIDVTCHVKGDLHVDQHHTTEDSAIALGQAISEALGDKKGITRYGTAISPMDEALARVALDISGRPVLIWKAAFTQPTPWRDGYRAVRALVPVDRASGGHHAAHRTPLWPEQPPHHRRHLQGLCPCDAKRGGASIRARVMRCRAPRVSSVAEVLALVDYGAGTSARSPMRSRPPEQRVWR